MLNVAITFDYEIFFGDNYGTMDEILFNPTDKLLELLDKYGVKTTFFVDVLSVYMHNNYGLTEYSEKFEAQLKKMLKKGHDIQLHIHSNWLKSTFANSTWKFDIEHYRIHSFGFDENVEMSVPNMIKWGKEYLENLAHEVKDDYQCVAYRAGGYCIQPHGELFECLLKNGIYIDSSVAIGQKSTGINDYDFSKIYQKHSWKIDVEGDISASASNAKRTIYEIPIYFFKHSLLKRLFNSKSEKRLKLKELRGTFIGTGQTTSSHKKRNKLDIILNYNKIKSLLSVDSLPYQAISKCIDECAKNRTKQDVAVSIIGHPKLIDDVWLENFEKTLKVLVNKNKIQLKTMQQISLTLNKE